MTTQNHDKRPSSPTVALLRASARGKLHRVIQAINEGAELAVNRNGHTALHVASHKGFLDIVRILLSAGCELDIQDDKGDTALHRACIAGHDLVVQRLIEEGCSIDRQNQLGDSALHEAASRGYSRCVTALIGGRANIGLKNKNQDTPMHLACANSHAGSLRLLLSSYPHASPRNAQGDTPLHIAVRFGHVTCARVLISARCNVDLQNKQGNSALHIATIAKHRKLVRVLLDAGAQVRTVLNTDGKSALDIAKDNDDGETAVMLLSGARHYPTKERTRGRSREKNVQHLRSQSEPRRGEHRHKKNKEKAGSNSSNATEKNFQVTERPKSATLPRKSYLQARAKWRRHERLKSKSNIDVLETHQRNVTVDPYVVPQLYSLYRDERGNVRQKPVIDQLPNPTPQIVSSIAVAVENTKGELLSEIKKTNQLLETRLDRLESDTDFKVAKLDQITKERINAERMQCLHRIDRRATLERAVCECRRHEVCAACQADQARRQNDLTLSSTLNHEKNFAVKKEHFPTELNIGNSPMSASYLGESTHVEKSQLSGTDLTENTKRQTAQELEMLRPYQTVKIDRGRSSRLGTSSQHNTVKRKQTAAQHAFAESLNRSDSAYGSLSPKPVDLTSTGAMERFPHDLSLKQSDIRKHSYREITDRGACLSDEACVGYSGPPPQCIDNRLDSHHLSEGEAEVTQKITQQFFENMTSAMEDWYERRLKEATERQQRELNKRVVELENKVKLLETRTSSDTN